MLNQERAELATEGAASQQQVSQGATRMRADARRNREQLITAARDVFIEQGADAPLDEIARRAGVGIATLYRRFPDRHTLIRQVMLDNMEHARAMLDRAADEHPDAWDALVQVLHDVVEARITMLVPVLGPNIREELHHRGEVRARREEVVDRIERLVQVAQQEGRLRGDIGLGDLLIWMVKVCRPLPVLTAEANDLATRRQLETLIDGLRATAAGDPGLPGAPLHDEPLTLAGLEARFTASE